MRGSEYNQKDFVHRENAPTSNVADFIMSRQKRRGLFVEGKNDELLYRKFITNNSIKIYKLTEQYHKEAKEEKNKKFNGGLLGDLTVKSSIIFLVSKYFHDDRKIFYGIVDKDYDDDNSDIKMIQEKYNINLLSSNRLISTDTNDAETLIFKNDMTRIQQSTPPECTTELWEGIIKQAIRKSCKLGYLRKKSNDNYENGQRYLKFKTVFNYAEDFFQYAVDSDTIDITNAIKEILKKSLGENYSEEIISYWINCIPQNFDNEWDYCRGHDLTGIIASLMYKERISFDPGNALQETQIQFNEKNLIKRIMDNLDVENFKNSNVIIWLNKIQEEAEKGNPSATSNPI